MKKLLMWLIKCYQKISVASQPHCRYVPTCSSYALEALEKHGAIKGTILAIWRLLRCNPFSRGGYDPVPDKFTLKREYKIYAVNKEKKGKNKC